MTLTATQANQFTQDSIAQTLSQDVVNELQRSETQIRSRARAGLFTLQFNATIIGNPNGDPIDDNNLTPAQIGFRDHYVNNSYKVTIDPQSGFWLLTWANVGAEILTRMYSVRTTVTPGAIVQQTIDTVNTYFNTLNLRATSLTVLGPNGGDIDETDFGAPSSTFYEYTSLVNQQDDTDHSTNLKTALRASGLGYIDETRITGVGGASNTTVPTNTIDIGNGTTTATITVGGTGTALDLVTAINTNPTLIALQIRGDINGPDVFIINDLAGTLIAANNVGTVLSDIFGLSSPQTGVLINNTEVYKFV